MERVLGHVDVDEMYLDVDPENLPDKGEIVETAHFFVGQAYNAHMMQRLIPKAAYEEERKSVKMQITDISEKISERRAKRVPVSEYVPITEFSEEKAKRFLSKVVVTMFTVTFVFYNGAKITRTYDNGQPGNKVGWNKKKEES